MYLFSMYIIVDTIMYIYLFTILIFFVYYDNSYLLPFNTIPIKQYT